jgi:hypothetical protein
LTGYCSDRGEAIAMKILQFLALVLTALALVPAGAHLLELPNKIDLSERDYFVVQSIYSGWAMLGIVLIGAMLANLVHAILLRGQGLAFVCASLAFLCVAVTLVIFFAFTFPANQLTGNWTQVPADWQGLRSEWEISHAVNAVITFIGFCALTTSVLLTRE